VDVVRGATVAGRALGAPAPDGWACSPTSLGAAGPLAPPGSPSARRRTRFTFTGVLLGDARGGAGGAAPPVPPVGLAADTGRLLGSPRGGVPLRSWGAPFVVSVVEGVGAPRDGVEGGTGWSGVEWSGRHSEWAQGAWHGVREGAGRGLDVPLQGGGGGLPWKVCQTGVSRGDTQHLPDGSRVRACVSVHACTCTGSCVQV
jgi:hypothetical protein